MLNVYLGREMDCAGGEKRKRGEEVGQSALPFSSSFFYFVNSEFHCPCVLLFLSSFPVMILNASFGSFQREREEEGTSERTAFKVSVGEKRKTLPRCTVQYCAVSA